MPGSVNVEQRGRVLLATLDNPPHALMDTAMVDGLEALAERVARDGSVDGVVLTGAHPDRFVAHYDVGELLAGAQAGPHVAPGVARTPAAGLVALERFGDILLSLERSAAVWVAALNGSAMGGGSELALACDVRLMADGDHGIGQPEVLLSFPPGGGGTQRLTRMIGTARALRVVLDGGPLSPRAAADLGIVDRVVDADELVDAAIAEAARLGSRTRTAVRACKRAVYEGGSLPLPDGLRLERAEFLSALGSPEAVEAMRAYLAALERSGELPLYDRGAREAALERGRYA
jgi:enoyl-CoA hydratase